jgi:hypothetical protein
VRGTPWRRTATAGAIGVLVLAGALGSGCSGDSASDITVAYRGDIAAYRELVHVRFDAGSQGRVVIPAFPSAATPEPIATTGVMQVVVSVKTADGAVVARDSLPPIELAPRTSYGVNVIASSRRPAETRCSGAWRASPIAPPAVESLYVSLTTAPRGNPPNCDD